MSPRDKKAAEQLETFFSSERYAIRCAKEGNPSPLIGLLSAGTHVSPEVRQFLMDHLAGKVRRPKHRPPRIDTLAKHLKIARDVRNRGYKKFAAIEDAARDFGYTVRTIKAALAAEKKFWQKVESLHGKERLQFVSEILGAMNETGPMK